MDKEIKKRRESISLLVDVAESMNMDYIQCFDNALSKKECLEFRKKINKFLSEGKMKNGLVGFNEENISLKTSKDINIYKNCGDDLNDNDISDMYASLHNKIGICIYSYLLNCGVLGKGFIGLNVYNVKNFISEDKIPDMPKNFIVESIKLRKYEKNKDGYHIMHYDNENHVDRILAVIVYLNDVKYGGETSFPLLKRNIKPKAGRIVVFPYYFTHMHYGRTSNSDKYNIISHIIDDRITYKYKQKKENENG